MRRRGLLAALCLFPRLLLAASSSTLRGRLKVSPDQPELITSSGKPVRLTGDAPTLGVLGDHRLSDADLELLGQPSADGARFDIGQIHTRSMFVHQGGKKLYITYWCDVCYIRTYTPGKCWCCQKDTDLDLRESLDD